MEISGNLSKQLFSRGSSRITLKNCLRDSFHLLKSPHLGCRFSDVMLLVREILLYSTAYACKNCANYGKGIKFGTNEGNTIQINIRLGMHFE